MKGSAVRKPGSRRPGREPAASERPTSGNEFLEWGKSLAIAVVLFLVIRTFLVQAYTIPSGSMEDTLLVGDYLMANNAIYGAQIPFTNVRVPAIRDPQFGDVVVFRPAYNDPVIDVVKRVVGEPGDTVQMIDRVLHRNSVALEEPYVEPNYLPDEPLPRSGFAGYQWHFEHLPANVSADSYHPTRDSWGPLVIPEGEYMLLGDNRDQSLDSRYVGFIPRDVIRGKAMFIYFSVDRVANRPFPRILTAARWDRIGQVIR